MTWDDALELARKVTRFSDGMQYYGVDPGLITEASGQLTLGFADPKTDKAVINSEGWKRMFQFMENVYTVPGNRPDKARTNPVAFRDAFLKTKNLAMYSDWGIFSIGNFTDLYNKGTPMNWDMTSMPTFKEAPGVGRKIDAHLLNLTTVGKHKDDAFQVINYLLSDESELANSKAGRLPAILSPEVRKQFGVDVPALKGKNTNVIAKYKPAPQYVPSLYEATTKKAVQDAYYIDVYTGKKDINTALRDAEEKANQDIATQKGK
jgi:multiple sugar transport system substrate-binding protein